MREFRGAAGDDRVAEARRRRGEGKDRKVEQQKEVRGEERKGL